MGRGSDDIREKDGEKLSFEMMYGADSTNDSLAAALQDFWKAIGVDAVPDPWISIQCWFQRSPRRSTTRHVYLTLDWETPSGDQSAMFHTDSYGAGFNLMKYSNPAYDEANSAASRALDPEERFNLLVEASNIVNDDLPVIIIWYRDEPDRLQRANEELHTWPGGVPLVDPVRFDHRVTCVLIRREGSLLPAFCFTLSF